MTRLQALSATSVSNTATTTATLGQYRLEPLGLANSQWSGVTLLNTLSEWKIATIRGLLGLLSRRPNWDSYGSCPPSQNAVSIGVQLILSVEIESFVAAQVVPVGGGGVQLEWSFGSRGLEIEINSDGSIEFLRVESGRAVEEGQISVGNIAGLRALLLWVQAGEHHELHGLDAIHALSRIFWVLP